MNGSARAVIKGRVSVYPSRAQKLTARAPGPGSAITSRSLSGTPVKRPVLIRGPPTSLLMHSKVTASVTDGIAVSSA